MTPPNPFGLGQRDHETVCAYIIGDAAAHQICGAMRQPGSAYCPDHHALCHIGSGTDAEIRGLREVEVLADAVAGRRSRSARPSRRFINRLEHAVRHLGRA